MNILKAKIVTWGKFFYKYRNMIAVPAFLLLIYFSKPVTKYAFPHILIIFGILIRLWAAGYIGEKARTKGINAAYRLSSGPYYLFKHPLYIGNFFLVSGTVFLYNPPLWFKILIIIIFLIEYSMIIISEEEYLKELPKRRIEFSISRIKCEISTILIIAVIYLVYLWILILK